MSAPTAPSRRLLLALLPVAALTAACQTDPPACDPEAASCASEDDPCADGVGEDRDGDGYGDCNGECDDDDPTVYPGAPEVCNGADDDCDGATDEDPIDAALQHRDADGDGWGDARDSIVACPTAGYVVDATDCDDGDASVHPGAAEVCDPVDQDCDGLTGVDDPDSTPRITCYDDQDFDGYGTAAVEVCGEVCDEGLAALDGDCDDDDATVHPGATDLEGDGVDGDCDGVDCTTSQWGGMTLGLCRIDGTFADAEALCATFGGALASVRNASEQLQLVRMMQQTGQPLAMIGLNDVAAEGTYVWGDGSTSPYRSWSGENPNDQSGSGLSEDCTAIQEAYGFGWNDVLCDFEFSGVTAACQRDRTDELFDTIRGTRRFTFGTTDDPSTYDPASDYDCAVDWEVTGSAVYPPCEGCTFTFDVITSFVDFGELNDFAACTDRATDGAFGLSYTAAYPGYEGVGSAVIDYYGEDYRLGAAYFDGVEFQFAGGFLDLTYEIPDIDFYAYYSTIADVY